ncbi:hypothetical protein [Streptomyces sp. IMTB 1903]|uniref:hypothetical protein n=1 Tax=Streptomyces sp. IMTB 1903 TaxID=1776680 RepID=UPI000B19BBA9|nr:hypothetical protein [Streptomyces sp. IMTB 1903]
MQAVGGEFGGRYVVAQVRAVGAFGDEGCQQAGQVLFGVADVFALVEEGGQFSAVALPGEVGLGGRDGRGARAVAVFGPRLRKAALTARVTASLGWFGSVAAFLALALAGLTSSSPETVRAAYVAMEVVGWFVIVPLSIATLVTGVVQSLGTVWGLMRHYWVIAKLLITVVATVLLLVHMQPVGHLADAAARAALVGGELEGMGIQLVADAGAAIVVLLTAAGLSVFKPRGMTRYGIRRRRREQGPGMPASV